MPGFRALLFARQASRGYPYTGARTQRRVELVEAGVGDALTRGGPDPSKPEEKQVQMLRRTISERQRSAECSGGRSLQSQRQRCNVWLHLLR